MIPLLAVVAVVALIAAAVLLFAWGRAEERATRAERQLAARRRADSDTAAHFRTVPRDEPQQTVPLPKITLLSADASTRPRQQAANRIYRVPRKDHNQR